MTGNLETEESETENEISFETSENTIMYHNPLHNAVKFILDSEAINHWKLKKIIKNC